MRIREATPYDASAIACVHVESWRTAYRGILPDDFLAELTPESREERWRERLTSTASHQFTLVVEEEPGRLVGFSFGGPERDGTPGYDGEIYAIYLLAEWRRQGIGRQLMAASAARLRVDGKQAGLLWLLQANGPACAFYETLGGQRVGSKPITIGPMNLLEVSYGWPDLAVLGGADESAIDQKS